MKNIKIAAVITLMVMAAYAIFLMALSHAGKLPVEKTLVVLDNDWQIDLPFEVSYWWNLLLFSMILVLVVYWENHEEIAGKEPDTWKKNEKINSKYYVRVAVVGINVLSLTFCLWMMIVPSIIFPLFGQFNGYSGPLSGLFVGGITYLISYTAFGSIIGATYLPSVGELKSQNLNHTYIALIKMGIIKTFPFLVGLSVGLMCMLVIEGIAKLIKGIVIAFKEEKKEVV